MSSRYTNQSELFHAVGPTVRPLQGLPPNKHGSSVPLNLGDRNITVVDARTESNDAEMIAVALGVSLNQATTVGVGSSRIDLAAHVSWGMGGANFEADIDLINGVIFSIPANYLRIDLSYDGLAGAGGGVTGFQASAGVAYGAFSHPTPPQRTLDLGRIVNTAGGSVSIPPFANSFTVYVTQAIGSPPPPPGLLVTVHDLPKARIATYDMSVFTNAGNQVVAGTFPIFNGAAIISFANSTGVDLQDVGVIFGIGL